MTKDEIIKQNMQDMSRVIIILKDILEPKDLTEEDEKRIRYCTKILKNCTEKQKKLNKSK